MKGEGGKSYLDRNRHETSYMGGRLASVATVLGFGVALAFPRVSGVGCAA
jgi:hypothetical protein